MMTEVEKAAVSIAVDRIGRVCEERVAEELATAIVDCDTFTFTADDVASRGIKDAIDEIDESTFDAAFDVVKEAVERELASQVKAVATRLIRA